MGFVDGFGDKGYLTVAKLFNPGLIDRIHDEYRAQFGILDMADPPAHLKVGDKRLQLPITMRGALLEPALYGNPLLLTILTAIFGASYLIDNINVVVALDGAEAQHLHRDHPDLFGDVAGLGGVGPLPPYAVTVAIPLVDLTPATGTTSLYPGSHKAAIDRGASATMFAAPEQPFIQRGGCLVMDYRLFHSGMANCSGAPRPVLYLIFARRWFTDVLNFKRHARIRMDVRALADVPAKYRPLFARMAAKGGLDLTEEELLALP